jgi:hypothetical protein
MVSTRWAFIDHGRSGTGKPAAVMLRPGNAGSNTAHDHKQVLADALAQLPQVTSWRAGRKVLGFPGAAREVGDLGFGVAAHQLNGKRVAGVGAAMVEMAKAGLPVVVSALSATEISSSAQAAFVEVRSAVFGSASPQAVASAAVASGVKCRPTLAQSRSAGCRK